jgi:hypothetical protein
MIGRGATSPQLPAKEELSTVHTRPGSVARESARRRSLSRGSPWFPPARCRGARPGSQGVAAARSRPGSAVRDSAPPLPTIGTKLAASATSPRAQLGGDLFVL